MFPDDELRPTIYKDLKALGMNVDWIMKMNLPTSHLLALREAGIEQVRKRKHAVA